MKYMAISERESKAIYLLKFFAIFSVVCAHIAVEPSADIKGIVYFVIKIFSALGTMGVPLFFFLSGYLFFNNDTNFGEFWKRKNTQIVVPWLFCESIVWLYIVLRKGGISLTAWMKFILGVYHSTYYLTILMFMYLVYFRIKKYNTVLIISIFISIVSIHALGNGCIIAEEVNKLTITPYLNPLNWMLYFSIGMIVCKNSSLQKFLNLAYKILIITVPLLFISFGIHYIYNISWSYYSKYALINIFLQIAVVFGGVEFGLRHFGWPSIFVQMGKVSYTIYLLHELIAGGVVYISGLTNNVFLVCLRPFVVIAIILIGIKILRYINKICNGRLSIFFRLTGLRE